MNAEVENLNAVTAQLRTAARFLTSELMLASLQQSAERGAFRALAVDFLPAADACAIAGGCGRAELDHNAKQGVIEKFHRGSAVVYSRKSIEAAIREGKWQAKGKN